MGLSLGNVSGGTGHVRECRLDKLALSFHLKESVRRRRRLAKLAGSACMEMLEEMREGHRR